MPVRCHGTTHKIYDTICCLNVFYLYEAFDGHENGNDVYTLRKYNIISQRAFLSKCVLGLLDCITKTSSSLCVCMCVCVASSCFTAWNCSNSEICGIRHLVFLVLDGYKSNSSEWYFTLRAVSFNGRCFMFSLFSFHKIDMHSISHTFTKGSVPWIISVWAIKMIKKLKNLEMA